MAAGRSLGVRPGPRYFYPGAVCNEQEGVKERKNVSVQTKSKTKLPDDERKNPKKVNEKLEGDDRRAPEADGRLGYNGTSTRGQETGL